MENIQHTSSATPQEEEIEDIGYKNTLKYIKNNYPKWRIFIIVLNLVCIGLIMYSRYLAFLQILLAIDFVFFAIMFSKLKKAFMQQFAKKYGYTYEETGNIDIIPALYLQMGHSRRMTNIIRGVYNNCPMSLFEFTCTIGYGKHKRIINFTTFEIEYQTELKSIFLRSKKNKWAITNLFEGMGDDARFGKVLKLEGNFNDYFTLYVPEDYEIEALQIFTPEVMIKLMDTANGFSFEFIQNKLFIYNKNIIYKKKDLENIYTFAKTLITDLAPRLERLT